MSTPMLSIGLVLLGCLLGSFGPLMFKFGADKLEFNIVRLIKNYHLYLGGFFYAIGTVLFIAALTNGELSVLYPLVATTYIWVSIWSMVFLKERMNLPKWLGITFIIIGALFIGLGS